MDTQDNNKPSSSQTHPHQSQIEISSADIIRLILHHLTEAGLHTSCRVLQKESGIKRGGISSVSSTTLRGWCKDGMWGEVLDCLGGVDFERGVGGVGRRDNVLAELMAEVHEMSILELADAGEIELARAAIRLLSNSLTQNEEEEDSDDESMETKQAKERLKLLQHKITELSALRTTASATSTAGGGDVLLLPANYYGIDNISKQKKRDALGKRLCEFVPVVPSNRLVSLLQQAVKWQCHTGILPTVKQYFQNEDDDDASESSSEDNNSDEEKKKKKRKKKKHKKHKKKKQKRFDLLLGEVDVTPTYTDDDIHESSSNPRSFTSNKSSLTPYEQLQIQHAEKIISKPYSSLRLGKKCYIESCLFFTLSNHYNSTETSLVTGSSDGCIEIWSSTSKYTKLRTNDLPYQAKDAIMMHYEDTTADNDNDDNNNNNAEVDDAVLAMCVNNENNMLCTGSANGTLYIWNITNGKCLRQIKRAHDGAILCCCFSFDSTKILSGSGGGDGNCREFGLRTSKMLKEFRGHGSFVNCCEYVLVNNDSGGESDGGGGGELLVVTGSGDGTVRLWDGRSSEVRRIIRPAAFSTSMDSGAVSAGTVGETGLDGPAVIAVFPLHSGGRMKGSMIVVTRSPCAYLVGYDGTMIRRYQRDDGKGIVSDKNPKGGGVATSSSLSKGGGDFVAATISATNTWLYVATEDGKCFCFNVYTGKVERVLQSFAEEGSTAAGEGGSRVAEITGLVHHPQKGMVVSYSNEKSQKRGVLTVWK